MHKHPNSMHKQLLISVAAAIATIGSAFAQDDCTSATAVVNGANGPFSNAGSTTSAPVWPCGAGANDVWFSYVATATGNCIADTCGGGYDSTIEAFSGTCAGLTSLGCNDDSCGLQSAVGFPVTMGTTYFIRVGGFGGATGSFPLNINVTPTPPNTLSTIFGSNNGGANGGAVYFDLTCTNPAGLTINDIDLNFAQAAGTTGTVTVYLAPTTHLPITQVWGQVSSGSVTAAGFNLPSNVALNPPVSLGMGCTVGVALVCDAALSHSYTNGTTFPQLYSNADLTLAAGSASNVPFTGAPFQPRVVNTNIHYSIGGTCPGLNIATVTSQGAGCVAQFASFYENFASAAAFDLANTCWTGINTGSGYVFTPGGALNAVGSLSTPTALALTDDSSVAAGTLGLTVGSNGWVALGAGNSNGFTPTIATLLSNPATAFYCWHDFNPAIAGSGLVQYEEAGSLAQVTYDGVWDFGGASAANASTVQFQYDASTGNVVICFGTMSTIGGTGFLVGFSPGGANADPGNTDISASAVIQTAGSDILPLALAAIGRPVQGAAAVPFQVTTSNIPASALIHIGIVGLQRPGLPLGLILGANGCFLNASLDVLVGPSFFPGPSFTWTALNLPALPPDFSGFQFNAQGAILGTNLNTALGLGTLTSNGLKCTVGTL